MATLKFKSHRVVEKVAELQRIPSTQHGQALFGGGLDGVECTDMFCWLRTGPEILNKSQTQAPEGQGCGVVRTDCGPLMSRRGWSWNGTNLTQRGNLTKLWGFSALSQCVRALAFKDGCTVELIKVQFSTN